MSRRSLFVALAFTLVGCQQAPRQLRRVSVELAMPSKTSAFDAKSLFARVDARLSGALPPPAAEHARCPDEALPHDSPERNTLLVRLRDARVAAKSILPLELIQSVAADPLAGMRESAWLAETGRSASSATASKDAPSASAASTSELARLTALAERRFVAELVVEDFSAPHHFRRLNAPRSEWSGGRFQGKLVIYDIESRRVLCAAPVHARGDAKGAPLSRRLREMTRNDLERKLYTRTRREMAVALSSITRVLRLPENESLLLSRND
ncbi:MAG: hypothetical protein ACOY0T_21920 [Myxococcota bacterium]